MLGKKKKKPNKVSVPSVPPPPESLEDEIRATWCNHNIRTLFKDFPRLAQRIIVLGSLAEELPSPLPKPGNSDKNQKSKDENLPTNTENLSLASFVVYINQEPVHQGKAADWPVNYVIRKLNIFKKDRVFLEILGESEEHVMCRGEASQVIGLEDSTRYFIIMQAKWYEDESFRNVGFAFYSREESKRFREFIEDESQSSVPIVGAEDFEKVHVEYIEKRIVPLVPADEPEGYIEEEKIEEINKLATELLSTASNLELNKVRDTVNYRVSRHGLGVIITKEDKMISKKESKDSSIILAMNRVIRSVASPLETPEKYQEICNALDKVNYASIEGNLELWAETFFTEIIGLKSKTTKLLKSITQAIIHTATYHIKSKVQNEIMTGDVRGPEGWQIVILFAKNVVYVTHRKREKSLETLGPTKQFWYEYMVHMVFDKEIRDLTSATLRISNIGFGDEIIASYKEELLRRFCHGNLLIQ